MNARIRRKKFKQIANRVQDMVNAMPSKWQGRAVVFGIDWAKGSDWTSNITDYKVTSDSNMTTIYECEDMTND